MSCACTAGLVLSVIAGAAVAQTSVHQALVEEFSSWSDNWADGVVEDWADEVLAIAASQAGGLNESTLADLLHRNMLALRNVDVMTPSHHPMTRERSKQWLRFGLTRYFQSDAKHDPAAKVRLLDEHSPRWRAALTDRFADLPPEHASMIVDTVVASFKHRLSNPLLAGGQVSPVNQAGWRELDRAWLQALDQISTGQGVHVADLVSTAMPTLAALLSGALGMAPPTGHADLPASLRAFETEYEQQFDAISDWEDRQLHLEAEAFSREYADEFHGRQARQLAPNVNAVLDTSVAEIGLSDAPLGDQPTLADAPSVAGTSGGAPGAVANAESVGEGAVTISKFELNGPRSYEEPWWTSE